jgi:hypothetical protein
VQNVNKASQAAAQRRAEEIRIVREELARLQAEGALALTDGQRASLVQHHDALLASFARSFDIDRDSHAKQLSLGNDGGTRSANARGASLRRSTSAVVWSHGSYR